MTRNEFDEINPLEQQDILFMMGTDDIDTAIERWNILCVTDEDGEDCLEFDLADATEKLGEEVAQEMDEHIRAYFAKRELEEKMNNDIAEGRIQIDDDGNIIDLGETEGIVEEKLLEE